MEDSIKHLQISIYAKITLSMKSALGKVHDQYFCEQEIVLFVQRVYLNTLPDFQKIHVFIAFGGREGKPASFHI